MGKIKTAIIGYGRSGRNIHTNLLKQLPDLFELVTYVDGDADRREMIKREMNLPVHADVSALYGQKIDLAVNSSFSKDHVRISRDLLEHGINVLCEKPVAKDAADFQTVLDTAKKTGKKFYAFQQYRFSPGFVKIREILASGVLGRMVAMNIQCDGFDRRWDWQTVHEWAAGVLLNKGPHYLDWALCLMGFPADVEVFASFDRANYPASGEDYAKLILRAPNAPTADLQFSACNAYAADDFHIHCTRGTLRGNETSLKWKYYKPDEAPPIKLDTSPIKNEKGEPVYCREKLNFYEEEWKVNPGDQTPQQYQFNEKGLTYYRKLYSNLINGEDFPVKNEQVLLQMKVIGEAHAQNRKLFV